MQVAFRAHAVFTDKVVYDFHRKVKEAQAPFQRLSAVGGGTGWFFEGVLNMRPLKQKKRICYEITAEIVKKVEELTTVGVDRIDFEMLNTEITIVQKERSDFERRDPEITISLKEKQVENPLTDFDVTWSELGNLRDTPAAVPFLAWLHNYWVGDKHRETNVRVGNIEIRLDEEKNVTMTFTARFALTDSDGEEFLRKVVCEPEPA